MQALDVLGWVFWLGVVLGFMSLTEETKAVEEPTSQRLQQVRLKFDEMNLLLHDIGALVDDVQDLTKRAAELEKEEKERRAFLGLSHAEREALAREMGLNDKAARKRDLFLFTAGVAAGVITNIFVK